MADSDEERLELSNRDKFHSERDEYDSKKGDREGHFHDDSYGRQRAANNSYGGRQINRLSPFRRSKYSSGFSGQQRFGNHSNNNRDGRSFQMRKFYENSLNKLMKFKHFIYFQDDSILPNEAVEKYNEYIRDFRKNRIFVFFEIHQNEEWLLQKYHPYHQALERIRQVRLSRRRLRAYIDLTNIGVLESVVLDGTCSTLNLFLDVVNLLLNNVSSAEVLEIIQNSKLKETSPESGTDHNSDPNVKSSGKKRKKGETDNDNSESSFDEEEAESDKSSFAPNHLLSFIVEKIPTSLKRGTLLKAYKDVEGFVRLCLLPPDGDQSFTRKAYLSFRPTVDQKATLESVKNIKFKNADISCHIDQNAIPFVRAFKGDWNIRAVVLKCLEFSLKIIQHLDTEMYLYEKGLPQLPDFNPEYHSDKSDKDQVESPSSSEASDNETLANDFEMPTENIFITKIRDAISSLSSFSADELYEIASPEALAILDSAIIYLRVVHCCDFYSFTRDLSEVDLPLRCPRISVRKLYPNSGTNIERIEKCLAEMAEKSALLYNPALEKIDEKELTELKPKEEKIEIDAFLDKNAVELREGVWHCPLSDKKFKGKEYVHKHIYNKFKHLIENIKVEVQYFNNYLIHKSRPRDPDTYVYPTLSSTETADTAAEVASFKESFMNMSSSSRDLPPRKRPLTRYVDLDAPETNDMNFF